MHEAKISELLDVVEQDVRRFINRLPPMIVLNRIEDKLDRVLAQQGVIVHLERQELEYMSRYDDQVAEISANVAGISDAEEANGTMITKLLDLVAANKNDPAALDAIIASTKAAKERLVADVLRGTPADPNADTGAET